MSESEDRNQKVMAEFRERGGKVALFGDGPLLILHHHGRTSGAARETPLMYQALGDGALAVFASKGGAPDHPAWYRNVTSRPDVTAEVGTDTLAFTAREALGEERDRIWEQQKRDYPQFAGYEASTDREIPVIVLDPVS